MRRKIVILLTTGTLLYFFLNFQRTAVPGSIFDELQLGLGSPDAKFITAIGAAFMYIYAAGQLLSGLMVDRYGGLRCILWGGLLFAVGSVLTPFTGNVWVMYLLRGVTGLGASCIYLSLIQALSETCPGNFTVVFGLVICIGYAGSIAAGSPFVAAVHTVGWKESLIGVGAVILLAWAVFAVVFRTLPPRPVAAVPLRLRPILDVFRRTQNSRFALLFCINWGLYYTFLTVIGKKFLEDHCRMSPMGASAVITAMAFLAAGNNFASGIVSRLAGNRRRPFLVGASVLALSCNAVIMGALLLGVRHWWLAVPLLLMTLTANVSPIQVAWTKEINPPDQGGISLATLNAASYFSVAVVSCIAGVLLEVFPPNVLDGVKIYGLNSYRLYFAFATAALVPGTIAIFGIRETAP